MIIKSFEWVLFLDCFLSFWDRLLFLTWSNKVVFLRFFCPLLFQVLVSCFLIQFLELSGISCVQTDTVLLAFKFLASVKQVLAFFFNSTLCNWRWANYFLICNWSWEIISNKFVANDLLPRESFFVVVYKAAIDELKASKCKFYFLRHLITALVVHLFKFPVRSGLKRYESDKHLEDHSTDGPDVSLVVVSCSRKYLWWHVQGCSAHSWSQVLNRVKLFRKAQISNLDFKICGQQVDLF